MTLVSDGITLHVPSPEQKSGTSLLKSLVPIRVEVAERLGGVPLPDLDVHVTFSDADFETLTQGRIPHWGIGVAYPQAMTMVLQHRAGQTAALLQTARHEFSHLLLHHALLPEGGRVPTWFNEGVAMWTADEWRIQQSFAVAVAAVREGLVPLGAVDSVLAFDASRAHLAYDQSYLGVLFLLHRAGQDAISDLLSELREGVAFDVGVYRLTGLCPLAFQTEYAVFVAGRFGFRALLTSGEAIWFYIVLLTMFVWMGVRMKNRATFARWEEEDPLDSLPLRLRAKVKRGER